MRRPKRRWRTCLRAWAGSVRGVGRLLGEWVLAWARLFSSPVRKRPHFPRVTVLLSVHNAAASVAPKIENLLSLDYPQENLDIIVACDGCTDDTAEVLRRIPSRRLRVVEFPQRRGKAACLAELVDMATPPKVTINEYVDVAKAFFPEGKESKFVNAVLDHMAREARPEAF